MVRGSPESLCVESGDGMGWGWAEVTTSRFSRLFLDPRREHLGGKKWRSLLAVPSSGQGTTTSALGRPEPVLVLGNAVGLLLVVSRVLLGLFLTRSQLS